LAILGLALAFRRIFLSIGTPKIVEYGARRISAIWCVLVRQEMLLL